MRNIKLIAFNTVRALFSMKILYLLGILILFVILINANTFSNLISQMSSLDEAELLSRQAGLISNIIQPWTTFTTLFGIIFAAGSVYWEKKHKTVVGVMAKPVTRAQFLLGKIYGVGLLIGAFLLAGFLLISLLMLYWGIPFSALFASGIVYHLAQLLVYITIAYVLSLYITPVLGGGIAFLFWSFGALFSMLMETEYMASRWLGYLLYYLNPANISDDLIQQGILNNVIEPEFGLYWSAIGENIFYAAILLYLGILLYRKKDIVMG